jgi:aspartate/methionine/tyrosine aminotransferase
VLSKPYRNPELAEALRAGLAGPSRLCRVGAASGSAPRRDAARGHRGREVAGMREISVNATQIDGQPMFKLLDTARRMEAAGRSIIHLEIGDPDFATPTNIVDAARASLAAGETHYVSSWGLPEFIDAIRETTQRSRGFLPDRQQVLVTPGANIAIFYAVFCLVNPGQEVLVPDPGFPSYLSCIKMCGARVVPYPLREENGFRIRAADIAPLITKNTRLPIINSPHNPTGAVTESAALREIFELAKRHDLYVYSDEIYSRMMYNQQEFFSIASMDGCRERIILSNGFSKAFAMTGWRLGVVVAPAAVAERMMMLLQTTSSCVSSFIQRAAIEALRGDQTQVNAMMTEFKLRRDLLINGLNDIPGITCHLPGGAFYAFPNIRSFGLSSEDFANRMLEETGVALLPGSNFGGGGEGFARVCYVSSRDSISEALRRLRRAVNAL